MQATKTIVDMCIDMCTEMGYRLVCGHVYRHVSYLKSKNHENAKRKGGEVQAHKASAGPVHGHVCRHVCRHMCCLKSKQNENTKRKGREVQAQKTSVDHARLLA